LTSVLSDTSKNIKWKIVVGHHPMYTGGSRTNGYDTKAVRNSIEPILYKYNVDVYLTGHEHSLQYLQPQPNKTMHLISGSASEKTSVQLIPEAKMVASEYGFMVFSITAKQLIVQVLNEKGDVFYTVSKPR